MGNLSTNVSKEGMKKRGEKVAGLADGQEIAPKEKREGSGKGV